MDRDKAVAMAQHAIKVKNKGLVDEVLRIKAQREQNPEPQKSTDQLPIIAVTVSTGWECYAVVEELVKTGRFRVRALYRTPGTHASAKLETLFEKTEPEHPGLLTLHSGVDMYSEENLTAAFKDCDGVVLYMTANSGKAGKITNNGNDPVNGRTIFMKQVNASLAALKANPSVKHVITLVFPTDKITGIADQQATIPWWIDQRLRTSNLLRGQGINVTCIHRPAYYYGMHRVDYSNQIDQRGSTSMSTNTIKENCVPGINQPDFLVNWVDVRDVGKWCGTVLEYPDVFSNQDFSIASAAMTGNQAVETCVRTNQHGTKFQYKLFPQWVMKMITLFNEEVVYPLRYSQWYNAESNGYDFASNEDLADLDRIHPRWTFEKKLGDWGITDIKPS
jgi:hypothetical protein